MQNLFQDISPEKKYSRGCAIDFNYQLIIL